MTGKAYSLRKLFLVSHIHLEKMVNLSVVVTPISHPRFTHPHISKQPKLCEHVKVQQMLCSRFLLLNYSSQVCRVIKVTTSIKSVAQQYSHVK